MLYSFDQQTLANRPTFTAVEQTDEELMSRVQARDDTAIAILYRRHTPLLRSVIGRILNNDSDVDDMLQVVFLEAVSYTHLTLPTNREV